ncbi:alpha/beta-hydrolase, partial [Pluteus cervinus]
MDSTKLLSVVGGDKFTILGHPLFPEYSVRVKRTSFCDETVRAYTGYIDVQARHLFFYFFESRNSPDQGDVIFWTNGGACTFGGCSSSLGLFMELGPCRMSGSGLEWSGQARFVNQPLRVWDSNGKRAGRTRSAEGLTFAT